MRRTRSALRYPARHGARRRHFLSMDFDDKCRRSGRLNVFAKNRIRQYGVALQFFSDRQQCNVDLYGGPSCRWRAPRSATGVTGAVDAQRMFGGTRS